jgi:predicted phosphodiesterase
MPRKPLADRVSPELLERIRSLRLRGWGPDRIYDTLRGELQGTGVTAKTLSNFLYRDADDGVVARTQDRLGKVADLLDRSGIPLDQIGKVKTVRLSEWQGLTKDAEGNAELHDLTGSSIVLTPAWDEGPAWPVVQPAKPTVVRPYSKTAVRGDTGLDDWHTAVIVPDAQVGYWRDLETGELQPFHDEAALQVVLKAVKRLQPQLVVLLGDMLDLAEFSRFDQEPGFALTTQASIDRLHLFLAELRANAPDAEIRYLEGNHDRRLQKSIVNNAKAAFGIRRAADPPDAWPVLSVPFLLRLDDLGVEYVGGYPAGITWINENLACVHGSKVRSAGSTAAAVIDDERVSVIFGHIHRIEFQSKTRRVYAPDAPSNIAAKHSFAASPGCLCRIDGTVPSTKGSTDPMGRPVAAVENWSQGFGVVTYQSGNGPFAYECVSIYSGEALLRGVPL